MDAAIIISICALVISVVSSAWGIYRDLKRDRQEKGKVEVSAELRKVIPDDYGGFVEACGEAELIKMKDEPGVTDLLVHVVNTGAKPITLTACHLEMVKSYAGPNPDKLTQPGFSLRLESGQRHAIATIETSLLSDIKQFILTDSTGKEWKKGGKVLGDALSTANRLGLLNATEPKQLK